MGHIGRTGNPQRKRTDIPDSNWRQALVPEGAWYFPTQTHAPGLALEKNGKTARFFFRDRRMNCIRWWKIRFCAYIQKRSDCVIYSQMLKICGYGESKVEEMLLDLIDQQTNPTIATYAKTKEVTSARGPREPRAKTQQNSC